MKIVECNPENIPAWIFPSAAAEWVYPETIADCLALGSGADIDKTSTDDWKSLLESIGWGRGRNAIEINGNGLENWVSIAQFFCYNGLTSN